MAGPSQSLDTITAHITSICTSKLMSWLFPSLRQMHLHHIYHPQPPSSPAKQHTPLHTLLPSGRGREMKSAADVLHTAAWTVGRCSGARAGVRPQVFCSLFSSLSEEPPSLHRFQLYSNTLLSGGAWMEVSIVHSLIISACWLHPFPVHIKKSEFPTFSFTISPLLFFQNRYGGCYIGTRTIKL